MQILVKEKRKLENEQRQTIEAEKRQKIEAEMRRRLEDAENLWLYDQPRHQAPRGYHAFDLPPYAYAPRPGHMTSTFVEEIHWVVFMPNFKIPNLELYDGKIDPVEHLENYKA